MQSPAELIRHVTEKGYREGVGALNDPQRVAFLVVELDAMATMKGLSGYYDSASGDWAEECAGALDRIGAPESARLIREANALFAGGAPARDWEARRDQLSQLAVEAKAGLDAIGTRFLSYPDGLGGKLEHFAAQHMEELRA